MPPKPRDEDLDFFGLTHQGLVRQDNQDHYLVCTLHKTARVWATSLPNPELLEIPSQRLASFGLVADGVGGHAGGEAASRAAAESVATYVTHAMHCFYAADPADEPAFLTALQDAAEQTHGAVLERARVSGDTQSATTLTLFLAVWPTLYLLQVGDSRCYLYRDGALQQLTRDQTMAQELVEQGVLPKDRAPNSPFAHVLTSSIGGSATAPEVTRTELRLGDLLMLCTDGLTKHVSDERIRERLHDLTSSEAAARGLVDDALAGGGTDNVTVLVLRTIVRHATP